ncbi:alpha/beta hydrolase family protein [Flavobacterium mesophilum]|uniref:alpha/beta hydrolase family protein n=1 Tax=Flavobacterium mesophilum TaxID=3143495 RepID=UPI0031E465A4
MKLLIPISKTFWISSLLLMIICPAMGQIKKLKNLSTEDYKLWSTLQDLKISDDASWISYIVSYESHQDTLFVQNIKSSKTISIPKGNNAEFLKDNFLAWMMPGNVLNILNLKIGAFAKLPCISSYTPSNKCIILQGEIKDERYLLQVCSYEGKIIRTIRNVSSHKISPDGSKIAIFESSDQNKISILDLKNNSQVTVTRNKDILFSNLKWHYKGNSLAFGGFSSSDNKYKFLYFYKVCEKKIYRLTASDLTQYIPNKELDLKYDSSFAISDNEENLFLNVKESNTAENENKYGIQVWNTKDKDLYPRRILIGDSKKSPKLIVWNPERNTVRQVVDEIHNQALVNLNQENILLYNENENKPSFKQNPDINYWIYNIKTGVKKKFLDYQAVNANTVSFSPDGKYFLYFKDRNWWLYSFEKESHVCLTKNLRFSFTDNQNQIAETPYSYGYAGWSEEDQSVFLYDQFDIWEFDTKNASYRQLTFGRKNQDIHRFNALKSNFNGNYITKNQIINPGKNAVIRVSKIDNSSSGYMLLDADRKLQKIAYDEKYLHGIIKAENKKSFAYISEDFDSPPQIKVDGKTVFKSNPQHTNFFWGRSKLISYRNSKGAVLNGVVFFPADYDPAKSYPMVVNIYQKQTYLLHRYNNPTFLNGSSLNVSNYTSNGYFVLLPDIDYQIGNPGFSALDCVTSAVNKITDDYPVNRKKIGLTGHSFGGYEVFFIVTQTNMFAAAVAGAAVADFNSHYLSYNKVIYTPEAWRYEHYQMRMGTDLFSDYNNYQNNSPLKNAANITTPLLSFSGNLDMQVDPIQSKEFYLALRRLQKEHIMLLYPNDNHVLGKPDNQKDLTEKTLEWFNFFLKGYPKSHWMEPK